MYTITHAEGQLIVSNREKQNEVDGKATTIFQPRIVDKYFSEVGYGFLGLIDETIGLGKVGEIESSKKLCTYFRHQICAVSRKLLQIISFCGLRFLLVYLVTKELVRTNIGSTTGPAAKD